MKHSLLQYLAQAQSNQPILGKASSIQKLAGYTILCQDTGAIDAMQIFAIRL